MIALHGVSKTLGGRPVLRDVSLRAEAGRVLAVLGPNGAGKSTILKTIIGLVHPDAGRLTLDGQPLGDAPAARARIGYMPQVAQFQGNSSAEELITMLKDLRRDASPIDQELIDRFGLEDEMKKPVRTLSGGNRQKVNAVIAMMFRPDVLLLDEPTASLDPVATGTLKDIIREERDAGRTCVIATHVLSEVEELADDVAFLQGGHFRFVGPVAELKQRTRQHSIERAIARLMLEIAA